MRKEILFLAICFCLTTICFGQKHKDFILTLHKDTLFGKVKMSVSNPHISFTRQRKRVYFHPKTLQAFGLYDKVKKTYKIYKAITNRRGKSMFVEVINEGKVKLYKYKNQEGVTKIHQEYYYIGYSDQQLFTIRPNTYEKTVKVFVSDYPNLVAKVAQSSYQEVPQIIASYNRQ